MRKCLIFITAVSTLTLLFSCRSVPSATGPVVWKSVSIDRQDQYTTARLELAGTSRNVLSGHATENDDGSWTVEAEKLEWFSNWHEGWSEAVIMVSGTLIVSETDSGWHVRAESPVRADYAASGAIRYRDTRLTGEDGSDAISRRINRISAAVEFLSDALESEEYPRFTVEKRKVREQTFEYRAGQLLFPEQYGYPAGTAKSENRNAYTRGEGIRWDTGYSEKQIPENLREVRNTGTLYRDWEETGELFYYIYVLENLNE